jgi:cell division septum initiation protein DivIVA
MADFTLRVDLFVHQRDGSVDAKLDTIIGLLGTVLQKEDQMSKELDDLTVQVQANADVEASAVTLIQGIAAQLAAASQDPVKIKALSSQLSASATSLAAAITANTPAA